MWFGGRKGARIGLGTETETGNTGNSVWILCGYWIVDTSGYARERNIFLLTVPHTTCNYRSIQIEKRETQNNLLL